MEWFRAVRLDGLFFGGTTSRLAGPYRIALISKLRLRGWSVLILCTRVIPPDWWSRVRL